MIIEEQLRTFRLDPEVAAARMPWAPEMPLDRLLTQAADTIATLTAERDGLQFVHAKARISAQQDALRAAAEDFELLCLDYADIQTVKAWLRSRADALEGK